MINPFSPGDTKTYEIYVKDEDAAIFESGMVHPVYATFALARDAEWACRLFVIEMKEKDEEGIGTMLTIEHLSPAKIGSRVVIRAVVDTVHGNEIICKWEASCNERLVARGKQGQKILNKDKLKQIFNALEG